MTGTPPQDPDGRRREIGEFLKAKRAALPPSLAGSAAGSRRRTRGLRREELAALAGVGVTWYTWLEQGRDIRVSADTLERIARALRLTPTDTTYLFSLAGVARLENRPALAEHAPAIQSVLDGFAAGPALVLNPFWDVDACNDLADRLFRFGEISGPFARNHIWRLFIDPARRAIYLDWPFAAKLAVGTLRMIFASHFDHPYARDLVQSLNDGSEEFRTLWSQQYTLPLSPVSMGYRTRQYGELHFTSWRFQFLGATDRLLVLLTPDTPETAAAMTRMADGKNPLSRARGIGR